MDIRNEIRNLVGANTYDDIRASYTYWKEKASVEKDKERKKRSEFYAEFIGSGDLYFDVGANLGNRIEAILHLGAEVVAIEPQRFCAKYLKKRYGRQITVIEKGCGAKNEYAELYQSESHFLSSFSKSHIEEVKNGRFSTANWNQVKTVELTTLDELITQFGTPKFVKIDVEGYEPEVLQGLNTSVAYISFEYMVPEHIDRLARCVERVLNVNPTYKFNYSVGESMQLSLVKWIEGKELKNLIYSQEFTSTDFGDIYAKLAT